MTYRPSGACRTSGAIAVAAVVFLACRQREQSPALVAAETGGGDAVEQYVRNHCLDCHDRDGKTAGLALDEALSREFATQQEVWESVVRKLEARQMPPAGETRPDESSTQQVIELLSARLDRFAADHPDPGRTETFRRLTRTEYGNAIRDLLALEVDVKSLLPADESSHGFDNVTVADLSPTLMSRYVSAAQKIARLAVGGVERGVGGETFRVRPDITQDTHIPGLPLGTRGGAAFAWNFPRDGEYEIQAWLMRDRNEEVEGLREPHEMEVLLDRERLDLLKIAPPPRGESDKSVDANLKVRFQAEAGPHEVAVTFLPKAARLLETRRQPLNVHYNFYRHPRIAPAVYQVSITGPYTSSSPGDSPSRQRIFTCKPSGPEDEERCAEQILAQLLRRAYRRPVAPEDLSNVMAFYRDGRAQGSFDDGIERALSAILVNPQFLFRVERDPVGAASGAPYRVSDIELASRLSFFLWSSIPDDELLEAAVRGELGRREELERQVRRMLADKRAEALVTNFADQWLYLRNLESFTPDARLFPDFGDNLRQAFRKETELLVASVFLEDRSVLDLIRPGDAFLNERLAKHYGIPHVYGSHFRRVPLEDNSRRGGILRHGSVLAVTSYATRTSPVLRGNWILENMLGTPTPPPPPNVPALEDNVVSASLPVRERLLQHRADPVCAVCHDVIDPPGFALENFDAVGRWRELEHGEPVDASGGLPGCGDFEGVDGLEQAILARPDLFARTLAEKLMTYALGRGVEYRDAPAVRAIVRAAREDDYRFSSLVLGIVHSQPFQQRRAP